MGSVLDQSLRETAATASQQIEGKRRSLGKTRQTKCPQQQPTRRSVCGLPSISKPVPSTIFQHTRHVGAFERVRQAEPAEGFHRCPHLRSSRPRRCRISTCRRQANLAPPPRHQVASAAPTKDHYRCSNRTLRPTNSNAAGSASASALAAPPDSIARAQPDDRGSWDMKSLLAAAESRNDQKPAIQHHRPSGSTTRASAPAARNRQQPRMVELRPDQMVPESTVTRAPHPATPSTQPATATGGKARRATRHVIAPYDRNAASDGDRPRPLPRRRPADGSAAPLPQRRAQRLRPPPGVKSWAASKPKQIGRKYRRRRRIPRYRRSLRPSVRSTDGTNRAQQTATTFWSKRI